MKYLILLLISFNVFALSFTEIDQISLDDNRVKIQMIKRILILDIKNLPAGEKWIISRNPIVLNAALVMPNGSEILAEFNSYIAMLRAEEQARLNEIARIKDIKQRWRAIKDVADIRSTILKCKRSDMNPALLLRLIINKNKQALLVKLENCAAKVKKALDKEIIKQKLAKDKLILLKNKAINGTARKIDLDQLFLLMVEKVFGDVK